jgi:hypothetical protein
MRKRQNQANRELQDALDAVAERRWRASRARAAASWGGIRNDAWWWRHGAPSVVLQCECGGLVVVKAPRLNTYRDSPNRTMCGGCRRQYMWYATVQMRWPTGTGARKERR